MRVRWDYRCHVYFHIQTILHHLGIFLLPENSFSKVKNFYITSAHYSICDEYGATGNETLMNGYWSYITKHGLIGVGSKATKSSPPESFTRWIITKSKGFMRKGIGTISRSVRAFILVLTSKLQARLSLIGN